MQGILVAVESAAADVPCLGPARKDIAELIWDARWLSLDQIREAIRYATGCLGLKRPDGHR